MTNSLIVARVFDKEHRNVMRDIRELIQKGMLKNEQTPMFIERLYVNEQIGQQYPMYLMNRDGFTLLAMGFTGDRALEFKMKFLQAFNAMGQLLTSDEYILMRSQQILQKKAELLSQKIEMLQGENRMLLQENKSLVPKAEYTDRVLQAPGNYTHSELAKELGFRSWKDFVEELKKRGIMFRNPGGKYQLYADYSGKGYTTTRTAVYNTATGDGKDTYTVWTEKGRMFLHELFGIDLPAVDGTMFDFTKDN